MTAIAYPDTELSPINGSRDLDILAAVKGAFANHLLIPSERITITVVRRVVMLQGRVDFAHQRHAAENVARNVPGVGAVINALEVVQP